MRKILLCTVMAFMAVLFMSAVADAVMIRNVSNQVLLIPIPGKGTLQLSPGGTATLTDADYASPAVQNVVRNGQIRVVTAQDRSSGNIMIRNVTGQVLFIQVPGKGTLQLAPNATATLTQADYASPAVQNLVRNGQIRVVTAHDTSSTMVMIRNVSGQALFIPIPGKGTLQLSPGATASITQSELQTPAIQNQLRNGQLAVVRPGPPQGVR